MFLIYGEDAYLINLQKEKILKKININEVYSLDEYSYLEDSLLDILNDANTIPMFAEKRIILVNDSYFLTEEKIKAKIDNKDYLPKLIEYLENPNPNTFIIFICPVNNISNRLKITKKMLELTSVLKAINLSYNELTRFIANYIQQNNGTISDQLINSLVEYLPNNLYIIKNELDKLLLISNNITKELIEHNLTKYLDTDIFKVVNYLLANDLNNFLSNYHYLKARGLSDIALIALITNNVILTRDIIVLSMLKKTPSEIANLLKVHPFRVKKISEILSNFSLKKANDLILNLFSIDYNIKKGIINREIDSDLYFIKLFNINR
ncbi:DNA polymerase III subunit delta [Spiroplasma chrysopicola]|uniref:DNA polymerase III subunit delta n=1 Tax=Spiroplasma chrysopicola DF-1 TaxID=1276227 RepID=R4UF12_9MOLU|nr:DNA polymerase III subunit delta [Spiroplasma chrysopicola]AGM24700.1 DNA polymerase III subunit delta [Spiroplasma chrysopicola DF-1]